MNSAEIIDHLETFTTLLELHDANPFKIRAYQNGIRALEAQPETVIDLLESGRLSEIKGIGKGLIAHIQALHQGQPDAEFAELMARTPPGLLELLRIPGLGVKKVKAIYQTLGISSLGELEYACNENRLAAMKGFGAKSQANVLNGIEFLKARQGLFLYPLAAEKAEELRQALAQVAGIQRLEIAGSLRRRSEVVRDINLLASCAAADGEAILRAFAGLPMVEALERQDHDAAVVRLNSGLIASLQLTDSAHFVSMLQRLTGSQAHNQHLAATAAARGLVFGEQGLEPGRDWSEETQLYAALGLNYIAPELREDRGEIELAASQALPQLVAETDLRGVFHAHTSWSDGDCSLEDMVQRCRELGYSYLGLSDHSQAAVYAHGLESPRVHAQWQEVDALNRRLTDFQVFKGIEVDILADGSLDYDDALLAGFDFVIASVHSRFKMSRDEMTERILAAARHPAVTMLGHLTGRLLLARDGYALDIEKVIDVCAENGTVIELNAHPSRLDLDWRFGTYARARGLKIAINPDAHSLKGLEVVRYGIAAARKGGFGPQDVINTRSLAEIRQWLQAPNAKRTTAAQRG